MTTRISTFLLSALLSCAGYGASAQSLPFDSTFGTNGVAYLDNISAYNLVDIALQTDGKILCLNGSNSYTYIERLNADGSLDETFMGGEGYKLYAPFPTPVKGVWQIGGKICVIDGSLIRQTSDGKIMGVFSGFSITRLKSNGTTDSSFGNNMAVQGFLNLNIGSPLHPLNFIYDMYDAKTEGMYFSSHTTIGSGGGLADTLLIAKSSTSGEMVTAYGVNGILAIPLDTNKFGFYNEIMESIFTKDGKILIVGYAQRHSHPANGKDMFVARYNLDGTLDNTFGTAGVKIVDFDNKNQFPSNIVCAADGSIFISGMSNNAMGAEMQYYTLKLSATGVEDASFGTGGVVFNATPSVAITASPTSTVLTSYGKVYRSCVYGLGAIMDIRDEYYAFNADGSPNTNFAAGGVTNPTGIINHNSLDKAFRMITQPDNKILILGADNLHPRIMRIKGDELPIPSMVSPINTVNNKLWVAGEKALITTERTDDYKEAALYAIDGRLLKNYHNSDFKNESSNLVSLQLPSGIAHGVYILSVNQKSGAQQLKFVH
jgi:uncharacterized delta-60 repeat protein